jgi:dipeptidyl aminopeptidase/acylaminoacyl peptidase
VREIVGVDEQGGWIYFTAPIDAARPYDRHGRRVRFDGSGLATLTQAEGEHRIALSPTKEWIVDLHASLGEGAVTELRRADGRLVRVLARADTSAYATVPHRAPRPFVVKAADGTTDLHGVLFVPFDFDSTKRYPVVEFIYQGMHSITAPKSIYAAGTCDVSMCPHPLAQLGFVTFVVDGRGTPGRGKAFQDAAWHAVGRYETADHVGALRQLAASRPWMDLGRVGIVGYSFGGYFAMRALLQAPGVYAAGVVGAPVTEFESATPGVIEPYLGPLAENRASYEYASNLRLADSLRARVLLIHGTADVNAPFSQTMKMVNTLTKAGKPYDLIVLPEEDHMSVGFGSEYALERMKRYLIEHLQLNTATR